jgi:hypothetical protein
MKQHTYLRAYMAGTFVPTIFLIVVATAFCVVRYVYNLPVPVERVIVFPMAVVPNLWGLWNMLFVASHARTGLSTGLHGALLPLVLAPLGILLIRILDLQIVPHVAGISPIVALAVPVAYYLVWKYVVGFLNRVLGIAQT